MFLIKFIRNSAFLLITLVSLGSPAHLFAAHPSDAAVAAAASARSTAVPAFDEAGLRALPRETRVALALHLVALAERYRIDSLDLQERTLLGKLSAQLTQQLELLCSQTSSGTATDVTPMDVKLSEATSAFRHHALPSFDRITNIKSVRFILSNCHLQYLTQTARLKEEDYPAITEFLHYPDPQVRLFGDLFKTKLISFRVRLSRMNRFESGKPNRTAIIDRRLILPLKELAALKPLGIMQCLALGTMHFTAALKMGKSFAWLKRLRGIRAYFFDHVNGTLRPGEQCAMEASTDFPDEKPIVFTHDNVKNKHILDGFEKEITLLSSENGNSPEDVYFRQVVTILEQITASREQLNAVYAVIIDSLRREDPTTLLANPFIPGAQIPAVLSFDCAAPITEADIQAHLDTLRLPILEVIEEEDARRAVGGSGAGASRVSSTPLTMPHACGGAGASHSAPDACAAAAVAAPDLTASSFAKATADRAAGDERELTHHELVAAISRAYPDFAATALPATPILYLPHDKENYEVGEDAEALTFHEKTTGIRYQLLKIASRAQQEANSAFGHFSFKPQVTRWMANPGKALNDDGYTTPGTPYYRPANRLPHAIWIHRLCPPLDHFIRRCGKPSVTTDGSFYLQGVVKLTFPNATVSYGVITYKLKQHASGAFFCIHRCLTFKTHRQLMQEGVFATQWSVIDEESSDATA